MGDITILLNFFFPSIWSRKISACNKIGFVFAQAHENSTLSQKFTEIIVNLPNGFRKITRDC